jgi:hypothetical protein
MVPCSAEIARGTTHAISHKHKLEVHQTRKSLQAQIGVDPMEIEFAAKTCLPCRRDNPSARI